MGILESGVFKIILSSAVIAALVTSTFNYLSVRKTNKRLIDIESIKRQSELETYRYTNIFESLKELNNLPVISYNYLKSDGKGGFVQDKELFGQVVSKATDRYTAVMKIYEKTKPLIDEEIMSKVILAVQEAERQSNLLTESLYQNKPLPDGVDVVTLMEARRLAENEIKSVMETQVSKLTNLSRDR